MMDGAYHVPVMADAVVAFLSETPPGPIVDGTCGGGGHTFALRERTDSARRIIGIDRDPEAIAETQRRVGGDDRITLVCGNFSDLGGAVKKAGVNSSNELAGIVLDLGVSSWQLDQPARGFTFQEDGPLDMRMDQGSDGPTARCIIRDTPIADLARMLADYGDVKRPFRVAQALKDAEAEGELHTTSDLARIVAKVRGAHTRGRKIHPATTVFQALRIAVNAEMDALDQALEEAPRLLMPGGRMVVISYHSGEDRRTKRAFRLGERGPQHDPRLPIPEPFTPIWKVLTRRPLTPDDEEVKRNPRSRSAKLRVAERTGGSCVG